MQKNGKLNDAAAVYRQGIANDPDRNPYTHELLGNVLVELGQKDEAIAAYRKSLELNPEEPGSLHVSIAKILKQQGKLREALAEYKLALSNNEDSTEIKDEIRTLEREIGK